MILLLLACAPPCPDGYVEGEGGVCDREDSASDTAAPDTDDSGETDEPDDTQEYDTADSGESDTDDTDTGVSTSSPGWEGEVRLPDHAWVLGGDRPSEEAGTASDLGGDVNGDHQGDALVGAPGSNRGAAYGGVAYVFPGPVTGDVSLRDGAVLVGEAGDYAGQSVAFLGDTNGDGYDDVLVGASGNRPWSGPSYAGRAYVVEGPVEGESALADHVVWTGATATSAAGTSVDGGVDLDGDGAPDGVVGAWGEVAYRNNGGAAYLLGAGIAEGGDLGGADVRILGEPLDGCGYEHLGTSVATVGDVNGDGQDDLALGATGACSLSDAMPMSGGARIFYGPLGGTLTSADADASVLGDRTRGDYYVGNGPRSVAGAGDTDGDGLDDLLLGTIYASGDVGPEAGAAWLVGGASLTGELDVFFADWTLRGATTYLWVGAEVAGAGDTDGDGHADVLIGVPREASYGGGAAWLYTGPLVGTAGEPDAAFQGGDLYWQVGTGMSGGADLSGDTWTDLLVGAIAHDGDASLTGAVFLLPAGLP